MPASSAFALEMRLNTVRPAPTASKTSTTTDKNLGAAHDLAPLQQFAGVAGVERMDA